MADEDLAHTVPEPRAHEPSITDDPVGAAISEARQLLFAAQAHVERADVKATVLTTVVTGGFAGGLAFMPSVASWADAGGGMRWAVFALGVLSLVALALSCFLAGLSMYPRLGEDYHYRDGELGAGDLVYFGRLRKIPPDKIAERFAAAVRDGSLLEHYAEQLHRNSVTAWRKHTFVQHSMQMVVLAALLAILALGLWGFI